jgi:hypothetical protein
MTLYALGLANVNLCDWVSIPDADEDNADKAELGAV